MLIVSSLNSTFYNLFDGSEFNPITDVLSASNPYTIIDWCNEFEVGANVVGRLAELDEKNQYVTFRCYIWRVVDEKNHTMFALRWADDYS